MKTIFTLLASLFITASVFAADAAKKSIIWVKSMGREDIRVFIDGKKFEPGHSSIMVQGIEEGIHSVKVYKIQQNGFFSVAGARYALAYNSTVTVRKRTQVTITIERNGASFIQEDRIGKNNGNRDRDFDYEQDGNWGDYDTHNGYESGMSSREFSRVLQSVDKEWFEGNKIKSAIQVVKTNQLSTDQVKQLVQLFSFENNKLELAKQAYANTVDKRNYDMIFDVFSFSSSKSELQRYIRNFR